MIVFDDVVDKIKSNPTVEMVRTNAHDTYIVMKDKFYDKTHKRHDSYGEYQQIDKSKVGSHRDTYYWQQLNRGDLPEPQTMATRIWLVRGLSFAITLIVWTVMSVIWWFAWCVQNGMHLSWTDAAFENTAGVQVSLWWFFWHINWYKFILCAITAIISGVFFFVYFRRNLEAQNAFANQVDINQFKDDQHIMYPEEMMGLFDFFPDVGAKSSVSVSSMLSHMMLMNKGLDTVECTVFPEDKDDDSVFYATVSGNGDEIDTVERPWIDEDFGKALFKASGVTGDDMRFFDATKIEYNPGNSNRDRLKGYDTLADLINGDWELPMYEKSRPSGCYIVDVAPVNTMV